MTNSIQKRRIVRFFQKSVPLLYETRIVRFLRKVMRLLCESRVVRISHEIVTIIWLILLLPISTVIEIVSWIVMTPIDWNTRYRLMESHITGIATRVRELRKTSGTPFHRRIPHSNDVRRVAEMYERYSHIYNDPEVNMSSHYVNRYRGVYHASATGWITLGLVENDGSKAEWRAELVSDMEVERTWTPLTVRYVEAEKAYAPPTDIDAGKPLGRWRGAEEVAKILGFEGTHAVEMCKDYYRFDSNTWGNSSGGYGLNSPIAYADTADEVKITLSDIARHWRAVERRTRKREETIALLFGTLREQTDRSTRRETIQAFMSNHRQIRQMFGLNRWGMTTKQMARLTESLFTKLKEEDPKLFGDKLLEMIKEAEPSIWPE